MVSAFKKEERELFGGKTLYRELGYYITTRKEQYERACRYFDQAVEKAPDDKRALLGRSIARAKAVQYDGALDDISKALGINSGDLLLEAQKSLYTYLHCNFEDALVANLRCLPKRKKPDNFSMGVMHCNEAIENCLGERAGRPLRDHFKIIRKLAWKKARDVGTKRKRRKKKEAPHIEALVSLKKQNKQPRESDFELKIFDSLYSHKEECNIIPAGPKFPYRPLQEYTSNIENYMASKYLESMYLDKIFLKNLKDNPNVKNPNTTSTKKILQIAAHGYKALSYKQELLRVRRPFYFIKFQEMTLLSPSLAARQAKEDDKIRKTVLAEANVLLNRIESCIQRKSTREALNIAEKLKLMCETKQKKYFPNRGDYLKKVYKLVAKAYLELKRLNKNQYLWDQEKRIHIMLGYKVATQPSKDSVIKEFKDVFINWKKQIAIAESRVKKAKDSMELAWLYHDLSRYHTELKQYELGRIYARKCIAEAKENDDISWVINATLLIVRINMQIRNKTDAKQELTHAINLSKQLDNPGLTEYLNRTMDVVEKFRFEDASSKIHEKREMQIIDIMPEVQIKNEVQHLFRQMAAMPVSRRMSVMPGVRFTEESATKNYTKQRMSILPTSAKDDIVEINTANIGPSRRGKKKKVKTQTEGSGFEFMKLLQFHLD